MELIYKKEAEELFAGGSKIKFAIFMDDEDARAILFPGATLHIEVVTEVMKANPDWEFIGAGALSKHAQPMWGSETCVEELDYDRPEDGGHSLLEELSEEISDE